MGIPRSEPGRFRVLQRLFSGADFCHDSRSNFAKISHAIGRVAVFRAGLRGRHHDEVGWTLPGNGWKLFGRDQPEGLDGRSSELETKKIAIALPGEGLEPDV